MDWAKKGWRQVAADFVILQDCIGYRRYLPSALWRDTVKSRLVARRIESLRCDFHADAFSHTSLSTDFDQHDFPRFRKIGDQNDTGALFPYRRCKSRLVPHEIKVGKGLQDKGVDILERVGVYITMSACEIDRR